MENLHLSLLLEIPEAQQLPTAPENPILHVKVALAWWWVKIESEKGKLISQALDIEFEPIITKYTV